MKYFIIFSFAFLLFLFLPTAHAQYVIQQTEYSIPITNNMWPQDKGFKSSTEEAEYFLNLPDNKLMGDKKSGGNEKKESNSTIYLRGNNFAVDSYSSKGEKSSTIVNADKGMVYLVMWPRKTVMEMSSKDMEEMQKNAEAAGKEMEKKLSPEMQKQMKEEEAEKKSQPGPEVKYTGKEKNINGFNCKQYLVEQGDNVMMIWAADDNEGVSKNIGNATQKMKSLFPSSGEEEKDEWELLPGKIPIVLKTYNSSMDGSHIEIQEITKISKENPPAGKFTPPGKAQGFTTRSMKDMMKGMMNSGDN